LTQRSTTVVEPQVPDVENRTEPAVTAAVLLLKKRQQLKPKKRRPPKPDLLTSPAYLALRP
jgi:hypothetical protein